jgi:hypothetical protein
VIIYISPTEKVHMDNTIAAHSCGKNIASRSTVRNGELLDTIEHGSDHSYSGGGGRKILISRPGQTHVARPYLKN